jgi:hypothetical protein
MMFPSVTDRPLPPIDIPAGTCGLSTHPSAAVHAAGIEEAGAADPRHCARTSSGVLKKARALMHPGYARQPTIIFSRLAGYPEQILSTSVDDIITSAKRAQNRRREQGSL